MICAQARVDSQRFRLGYLDPEERRRLQKATAELSGAPLYIDDSASSTLIDIYAKLQRMKREAGLGLAVVDYLQLMAGHKDDAESRNQEVSGISRGLKLLARDLGIPILGLSQLSRAPEQRMGDHRPQLSDLRESGSLEQDADVVGFIFRPEVYKRDDASLRGLAELILAKQRNGPIGKVHLTFLHQYTKFEDRVEDR